ncbi:MAG: DUF5674 family protein [Coriobacteriia bacterium]|nr:DUF5674 family protein [Coriobacteriia bacterium]
MKKVTHITLAELAEMAQQRYGDLVKAVVDIEQRCMVVDAEMHADEETYLLESGSRQENLWGINLYPEDFGSDDFVEFDSMINIRPSQGNRSRSVEDASLQKLILDIVAELVHE